MNELNELQTKRVALSRKPKEVTWALTVFATPKVRRKLLRVGQTQAAHLVFLCPSPHWLSLGSSAVSGNAPCTQSSFFLSSAKNVFQMTVQRCHASQPRSLYLPACLTCSNLPVPGYFKKLSKKENKTLARPWSRKTGFCIFF